MRNPPPASTTITRPMMIQTGNPSTAPAASGDALGLALGSSTDGSSVGSAVGSSVGSAVGSALGVTSASLELVVATTGRAIFTIQVADHGPALPAWSTARTCQK